MTVEPAQNEPWTPQGVAMPMSWDPVNKIWTPSPPAAGSITTAMLAANAATFGHVAVGVASNPAYTGTAWANVPDMSITFTASVVEDVLAIFLVSASLSASTNFGTGLQIDGGGVGAFQSFVSAPGAGLAEMIPVVAFFPAVAAGPHTINGQWNAGSATVTGVSTVRSLFVLELRR